WLVACGSYHAAPGGAPAHPGHRHERLPPAPRENALPLPGTYVGSTRDTAKAVSGSSTGARPMRDRHPVILGRDAELAVLGAAADAAEAGHAAFVLVEGPAGIGKTTLLRMACARPAVPGPRILT